MCRLIFLLTIFKFLQFGQSVQYFQLSPIYKSEHFSKDLHKTKTKACNDDSIEINCLTFSHELFSIPSGDFYHGWKLTIFEISSSRAGPDRLRSLTSTERTVGGGGIKDQNLKLIVNATSQTVSYVCKFEPVPERIWAPGQTKWSSIFEIKFVTCEKKKFLNYDLEVGKNLTLNCLGASNATKRSIDWSLDNIPINQSGIYMELINITEWDEGVYQCWVSKNGGNQLTEFNVKPRIILKIMRPENKITQGVSIATNISVGRNYSRVTGLNSTLISEMTLSPNYKRKNKVGTIRSTRFNVSYAIIEIGLNEKVNQSDIVVSYDNYHTDSLTIKVSNVKPSTFYALIFTHEDNRREYYVFLTKSPAFRRYGIGDWATLTCGKNLSQSFLDGTMKSISWRKTEKYFHQEKLMQFVDYQSGIMLFDPFLDIDTGGYTCSIQFTIKVDNVAEVVTYEQEFYANIASNLRPSVQSPAQARACFCFSKTLKVEWKPVNNSDGYTLLYYSRFDPYQGRKKKTVIGNGAGSERVSVSLDDLEEGVRYTIHLAAFDEMGHSEWVTLDRMTGSLSGNQYPIYCP